ncbi:hypothetical protein [Candidatus Igneacidithiobacillus taiwanensis]|uniref:hypothetical protein n=1 Tax=Candidatus Igneacidithiobacillus taiwanensis TaxID=1945924 RepID=UPI00289B46D7|nr:hypothetical protein [Candidatus Igneacidithiobacillus taiwanensis]
MHTLKTLMLSAAIPAISVAAPSLHTPGVGSAEGQALNTAQAWRIAADSHTLIGQGGLPLITEEQSLWNAWRSGRIGKLPVLAWGDGAVIYPLGLTTPILQTSPDNFSVIVLNKGAVPSGMLGAPGAQWIVKTTVAGHHAIVAVSPRFVGIQSNLQIFATGPQGQLLTYTVGLVSGKERYTPQLSFYRDLAPQSAAIPLTPVGPGARTVVGGSPAEGPASRGKGPKIVASHLSVNWQQQCVIGDCSQMMPLTVASTKTQTFVHFSKALQVAPLILPKDRQGNSWYAPSRLTAGGKTLIVDAAPWRLDLLQQGPGKQIMQIRLTRGGNKEGNQ